MHHYENNIQKMDWKDINDSNGTYDKSEVDEKQNPILKLRSSRIGALCRYLNKKGCNKTTNDAIETVHHGYFYATVVVGIWTLWY